MCSPVGSIFATCRSDRLATVDVAFRAHPRVQERTTVTVDQKIEATALDILRSKGPSAVTIEAVAHLSGVDLPHELVTCFGVMIRRKWVFG